MDQNFATKADFKEFFMTKNDLKDVQNEMKDLKTELQTEIKDFRVRLSDQTLFFSSFDTTLKTNHLKIYIRPKKNGLKNPSFFFRYFP